MLTTLGKWTPVGLLILGVQGSYDYAHHPQEYATVTDTTTIISPTTLPVTHYVDVTVAHYVNVTETSTIVKCVTESTTTTIHYTVSVTETDSATITNTETDSATVTNTETDSATVTNTETDSATVTNTETDSATVTNTETDSATVTNTETDSATVTNTETDSVTVTNTATETTTTTVPATITTYSTRTIFSTTYDPCPKSCSISAATVNLFFWPTNRPYTYPSTYVDKNLAYTFTSPSVYMLIPTARGINTLGQPAGPSTTSWILPLDLYEVSTIVDGSVTRQLTLSDLGTDCPQTADPTAIASMVDSRCDPVLAAPRQVSSWAYPCNACGRFGLFDPPYAIPTITGGLIGTSTPPPVTVTAPPPPASTPPVGVLLVIYYVDGKPVGTATLATTGITGTVTSSVGVSSSAAPASATITSPATPTPSSTLSTSPTSVVTASATRVAGGLLWLVSGLFVVAFML